MARATLGSAQRDAADSTWDLAMWSSLARRASTYPTLLADFPAPEIVGYSRESVIAEKFHAMVRLGRLNSRMNDFFDMWLLVAAVRLRGPGPCGSHFDDLRKATHRGPVPSRSVIRGRRFASYPGQGGAVGAAILRRSSDRGCAERLRRRDCIHLYVSRAARDRACSGGLVPAAMESSGPLAQVGLTPSNDSVSDP